jgi:hypothetical protein
VQYRGTRYGPREQFGQVQRRVRPVVDAEQQHLAIEVVHTADRAAGEVRRQRQRVGGDLGRARAGRREGERMIAADHAGQAPECVGDDAQVGRGGHGREIERHVVVGGRRQHDQRTVGTECGAQRLDQAARAAVDRAYRAEGRVDQQHAAVSNAERPQLPDELRLIHGL